PDASNLLDQTINVYRSEDGVFHIEGNRIDKMLGYTNLDSEKGFLFFQKFIKTTGIEKKLLELGIQDKDTVDVAGNLFEYYK
ncbi:MAG: Obg family GTPase CgtA, partial [Solobacterium sp.]|nr:Obg family GTPase CgtA [Solobacterium sp.]